MSTPSRQATPETSQLHIQTLQSPELARALSLLLDLVRSSYGPRGQFKVIQNAVGGHVTVTSSAARLFRAVSVSKPVIRLLVSAAERHLAVFGDGGLFLLLLSVTIVRTSLALDIHRHLLTDVYERCLKICMQYLESDDCPCKVTVAASELISLVKVASGVIQTKRMCNLRNKDVDFISCLVVEAFLKSSVFESVGSVTHRRVGYLCVEGAPLRESRLVEGVLFDAPHIPPYSNKPVATTRCENGKVKVILVNVSMSGDWEALPGAVGRLRVDAAVSVAEGAVEAMSRGLCRGLLEEEGGTGVGLLACQKVVHPRLAGLLRRRGVLVLERLGGRLAEAVRELTGATTLSSLGREFVEADCGWLDDVQHTVLRDRSYLHLTRAGSPVCSLVLCQNSEESLEEMKSVCEAALTSLQQLTRSPRALCGAGCWQLHLAAVLRTKLRDSALEEEWMEKFFCSKVQLRTAVENFAHCLDVVAMATAKDSCYIDEGNAHMWVSDTEAPPSGCACGCFTNDGSISLNLLTRDRNPHDIGNSRHTPDALSGGPNSSDCKVLDVYATVTNAFKVGVLTANAVLRINHFIQDIN